jgi:hypothetical protein
MAIDYPWKRFWAERGTQILLADHGFLPDPETEEGQYIVPELAPLQIDQLKSCTVLLGEPGMGKSKELGLLHQQVPAGDTEHFLNLGRYGDENRLIDSLSGNAKVSSWLNGQGILHLFLDSLDECLLRVDTAQGIIADELQKFSDHRQRLRFYITSRTAPWPDSLEKMLQEFFGESEIDIREIAPLRRKDVLIAAEMQAVADSSDFVHQIVDKGVASLAIKPVTLAFLIGSWRKENSFPTSLLALYREGCRRLCDEDNPDRRSSPRLRVDPNVRLAIVSRIAFLTQLGNRFAIWKGRPSETIPDEDVPLHELVGGEEANTQVTEELARDALNTGLFSARGSERIGWAHLTYGEFLASAYANKHALSLSQLRTLFFHPSGTGLIPQLAEVAAWTALANPALLREIAMRDPMTLLNSGVGEVTNDERKMIVDGLIEQCRQGKYLHFDFYRTAIYSKLAHPTLGNQLLHELLQGDRNVPTKSIVISIGHACGQQVLCDKAVAMTLDEEEDLSVRQSCAYLLSELGSESQRKALAPLLIRDGSYTHLKALVIDVLWPKVLSTDEVFQLLPEWKGKLELLNSFLHGRFLKGLEKEDLKPALQWIQHDDDTQDTRGSENIAILKLAWGHLDDPEVVEAFAKTVVSKLGVYGWFENSHRALDFQKLIESSDERRRILVRALLSRLTPGNIEPLNFPVHLALPEDAVWLIDQFGPLTEHEQEVAVDFIGIALQINNAQHMTALYFACEKYPLLADQFSRFLKPIALDEDWVKQERQRLARQKNPKPLVVNPPSEYGLEDALEESESEGPAGADVWLIVVQEMEREPGTSRYGNYHEASVLDLHGWTMGSEQTKLRIMEAAKQYLRHSTFFGMAWPDEGKILEGAYGTVQALWLYVQRESPFIQTHSDLAAKCVQSVVRIHVQTKSTQKVQEILVRALMGQFSDAVHVALIEEICQDNDLHGYYLKPTIVEASWTPALGEKLLQLLGDGRFKSAVITPLLTQLLQLFPENSIAYAQSIFTDVTSEILGADTVRAVALGWMKGEPKSAWMTVWPLMQNYEDFAEMLVSRLSAPIHPPPKFLSEIDIDSLADFYIWMAQRYPDPPVNDSEDYKVRSPDHHQYMKHYTLEHIKQRGSFKAVAAIRRVMESLPQIEWLRAHLDDADLRARAVTWEPFSVSELRMLMASADNRLIGSERDLQEILLESLALLQHDLRGETPSARFLWDMSGKSTRPKEEEALSDFILNHLRNDFRTRGIVINREVQIRRANPQGEIGQRTDIHVNAISASGVSRVLTVIIEVKGCWNPDLKTAMQAQLRDRYLRESSTRTGIYVAGWYASAAWDSTDPRKSRSEKETMEHLRTFLGQQAANLSTSTDLKSVVLNCSLT